MGKGKYLITVEKQNITKLLNERIPTLKISMEFCRDHRTIQKTLENITNLKTRSKEKALTTCFLEGDVN